MKHGLHVFLFLWLTLGVGSCTFDTTGLREKNNNNTNNILNNNNTNNANNINNTNNNPNCGNGVIDEGEICDGAQLDGKTCTDLGFAGGTLACASNCTAVDTRGCTDCGNGILDIGETCDGTQLGDATCLTEGFPGGGDLACRPDCTLDTSGCVDHLCGNGTQESVEECDGGDLAQQTCVGLGFVGGDLVCTPDCQFDMSGCHYCGNNQIDAPEQCDGTNLGGASCATQGFFTGDLVCTAACTFDISRCTNCGNNILNEGEICDGTDFGGQNCRTMGCRMDGLPACNLTCSAVNLGPCQVGHDEDGDGQDDNCDNCPSVSNLAQTNGDGDEVGDVCERPNNASFVSKIRYFESFASAPSGWTAYGGSWSHQSSNNGSMEGSATSSSSTSDPVAYYLYNTPTANNNYIVEVNFHYRAAASGTESRRTGVFFAYNVDGGGNLSRAYRCVLNRNGQSNSGQLELWRYTTYNKYNNGGWQLRVSAAVPNLANYGANHTIRAFVQNASGTNNVVCQYVDAQNPNGVMTGNWADQHSSSVLLDRPAGLTVENDVAQFTSYVYYAN